jgi:lipopolysaccharide export system protein LptA
MSSWLFSKGLGSYRTVVAFCLTVLFFSFFKTEAQQKKKIDIIRANSLESSQLIIANAQRLIGDVLLKHNEVLISCDSAYSYTGTNKVDGFGHVHINQGDTLHLYSDRVFYSGDNSFARAFGNVKLVKRTTSVYSDTIDYDLKTNVGYYDDNGKIIDSTTILTSKIGRYYVDRDLIYFYEQVEGHNEKYNLTSDSISYNPVKEIIYINSPTTIKDTANTLYAEKGWYETKTGNAELTKNPVLLNKKQQLTGQYIKIDGVNKKGIARGNVEMNDFENQSIVKGMFADYDENKQTALVTDSAVFMMCSKEDTLYLHADTLRSIPDTIKDEKLVFAYFNVRFYRKDVQGICDSLVYFTKDSTAQFYTNPVLWSDKHQLSADYILMKSNAPKPDEIHLSNNSFIISQQDSVMYDQIKGKNMIGYIEKNQISRIDVSGNGQTLYYASDKEQIIGLNHAESSKISIKFKEGKINKISFLTSPTGKLTPLDQLKDTDRKLLGFDWKQDFRPISKDDIFRKVKPVPLKNGKPSGK